MRKSQKFVDEDVTIKEGKYSRTDTKQIIDYIKSFVEMKGIELADVIAQMRDVDHAQPHQRHGLWHELQMMLPNRTVESIQKHATRKIMKECGFTKPWSQEDDMILKDLMLQHGNAWVTIGKIMRRHDGNETCIVFHCEMMAVTRYYAIDDIKGRMRRFEERELSGRFSLDEDSKLLRCIQKYSRSKGKAIEEMDDKRLPWDKIRHAMGNKRHALDYLRRWIQLRAILVVGVGKAVPMTSANAEENIQAARQARVNFKHASLYVKLALAKLNSIRLLNWLHKQGFDDVSDFSWTTVDKELNFLRGESRRRWLILCKECPFESEFGESVEYLAVKYKHELDYEKADDCFIEADDDVSIASDDGDDVDAGSNDHRSGTTGTASTGMHGYESARQVARDIDWGSSDDDISKNKGDSLGRDEEGNNETNLEIGKKKKSKKDKKEKKDKIDKKRDGLQDIEEDMQGHLYPSTDSISQTGKRKDVDGVDILLDDGLGMEEKRRHKKLKKVKKETANDEI